MKALFKEDILDCQSIAIFRNLFKCVSPNDLSTPLADSKLHVPYSVLHF